MRRAASVVSLVIALILLGTAAANYAEDSRQAPDRISAEFADVGSRAFDRDMQAEENAHQSMAIEAIAGAAFLIAGLVLWSGKKGDRNAA